MASIAEIQALVEQIKADLPLLINRSQIAPKQVVIINGLSDMSERLGLIQAGEFRSGNGKEPGFLFSGVRIGYPAFAYAGDTYNFVGVNADVLQIGISADDGKLYFGAGAGTLESAGIVIVADLTAFSDSRAYKFKDSDGDIMGGLWGVSTAGANDILVMSTNTNNAKGTNRLYLSALGGTAQVRLEADNSGASLNAVFYIEQTASAQRAFFQDIDTIDFNAGIPILTEQGSNPSTPPTSDWKLYFKSDGLYIMDDAGLATGPLAKAVTTDGWTADTNTWTRTGNHVFTLSVDATAYLTTGTLIRYKDGGAYEYGVVFSSAFAAGTTTVTLITNTSYTMAAATITDTYFSHDFPTGFPSNFSYTPAWVASGTQPAIGNGTQQGFFSTNGRTMVVTIFFSMGSTTTYGTGTYTFGLPCVATAQATGATVGFDAGTAIHIGTAYLATTSAVNIVSEAAANVWGQLVPHTWANTDYIRTSTILLF